MRKTLLAAALVLAGVRTAAADEWVVEASYPDAAALARAAKRFEHVIVDAKRGVLRVATNERGIQALEDAGLGVGIDVAATARLQANEARVAAAREAVARSGERTLDGAGYETIPGYECFRSLAGTYATMDDLVANHPDIAAIDAIGPTWLRTQDADSGFTMRALRITNLATAADDAERPRMVVFSSIHAREYAPAEVDTRFAEFLVNGYGVDPEATWLVDHNDFRLVLEANPDGRALAEQQVYQRKNMNVDAAPCDEEDEFEQPGVDLNRNFPFHWNITHGQGSSGDFCDQTYRGPVLASEPETQNLVRYVAGVCDDAGECGGGDGVLADAPVFADRRSGPMNPSTTGGDGGDAAPDDATGFFVDIHSNAALVMWPWGDTSSAAPNRDALRTLGRRLAYFNGYTPEQSDTLYPTDGATDDTFYGLLGVAAFTIETDGADFFQDCGSFEASTAPNNVAALRYAARSLHAPYRLPAGPDAVSVTAEPDLVAAGDAVALRAHLDASRFNQSNGSQAIHDVAAAAAVVDALPWQADAIAQPLAASDGAFDAAVEDVDGVIDTSGFAPGRHLVYVQGTDDAGAAGTPNAAFVEVADAAQIAAVAGRVAAFADGSPVAATITVSDAATGERRQTTSDASDGDYRRTMLAGTVDVHVDAPGYLAEDATGLVLDGGQTLTRNFSLLPNCTIFADDVESGASSWSAQSPWTIVANVPGNATHVWNTPNYGNNLDRSLTTATSYDVTGYADLAVDFDDRCATENGYDYGYLEYSADGGSSWTTAYACTGQTAWQTHHVALPADANGAAALKLRFRLHTDPGVAGAGWAVDNVKLEAGGDACRAQQPPTDVLFKDGFDGA
ncbi:MAG TPA: M14 family zinc carboxypeptidase [Dokdonella sp.]